MRWRSCIPQKGCILRPIQVQKMRQDFIQCEVRMKFEYDLPNLMQLQRQQIEDLKGYSKKRRIRGIYALFNGGQLVYVGISLDLYQRLVSHKSHREEAPCTEFAIQEFSNNACSEILIFEAIYIDLYRPIYNKWRGFAYLYS